MLCADNQLTAHLESELVYFDSRVFAELRAFAALVFALPCIIILIACINDQGVNKAMCGYARVYQSYRSSRALMLRC